MNDEIDNIEPMASSESTGAAEPKEASASQITGDAETVDDWTFDVKLGDTTYTVVIDPKRRIRLASLIRPKPIPDGNELQVLEDHRWSVYNVWQLTLNWINQCVLEHDKKKLEEKEQHAALQPHHWPLDGYDTSDGYLPITYVVESVCDYVATIFGRCEAGRPLEWLSPTNNISAGDVLTASCLGLLQFYDLATITPPLKNSGVGP